MGVVAICRVLTAAAITALALAAPASATSRMQPVDERFQDQPVLENLDSPMAVRFAPPPDGRIFVAEKSGRILAFDDEDDATPVVTADLSQDVHDFWDRGMLGLALDPAFATNGRIYVLYTRDAVIGGSSPRWGDGCPNPPGATAAGCVVSGVLARITVNELGVASELTTLIEDEWCQQFPSHSVGTVAFGPDGMLYVGAGEGANFYQRDWGQLPATGELPPNPCGDPPGEGGSLRSQDVRTPADPTGLSGAILRLNPNTGAAAPGNPFAGGDAGASRLIAYGLRNPFRWAFRPGTSEIWLGDVGQSTWEELDVITDAGDDVAENFGWPCYEGAQHVTAWDGHALCADLEPGDVTPPAFTYEHWKQVTPGDGCRWDRGGSISGIAFPSGYGGDRAGNLFFADYSGVCIFAMGPGADGRPDPSKLSLFARGDGTGGPVELQDGPGGDLYYTYYDPQHPADGSVHRIRYTPGNRAPEPEVAATPSEGAAPLDVAFSAAGTTDPDGDALEYAWDLDGDGDFDDATGLEASRTYSDPGSVRVGLLVTDALGATADAHVTVTAGNTAPRPAIASPANGASWSVGQPIEFSGSAADDQEALGPGALEWILTLDHCPGSVEACHTHPIEKRTGASGTILGPEHDYPSRVVLTLVAKDSGGLTGSTSVRLEPRAARVHVVSDTTGTVVSVDGVEGADVSRTVIAGSTVTVGAAREQRVADELWRFGGWSDGALDATRLLAPQNDVSLTARFARAPTPAPNPAATPAATPEPTTPPAPLRVSLDRPNAPRTLAPKLSLRVRCSEACTLSASAALAIGGRKRGLPAPKGRAVAGGRRFDLRVPARLRARARRALRTGRKVRIQLRINGRDAAGVRHRSTVTVPLRLG
jgi:glucose/arabinose dehydrogenase